MIVDSPWFLRAVILCTVLMVGVWSIMLMVTMPHLQGLTGGLPVFDMRPMGYTFEEAKEVVTRLGPTGIAYYIERQQVLDLAFPALIFLTVSGWEIFLARKLSLGGLRMPAALVGTLVAVNLMGAVADYGENGAVRGLLEAGPDAMDAARVASANAMTIAKSALNTLSYLLVLGLAALHFWRRRKA